MNPSMTRELNLTMTFVMGRVSCLPKSCKIVIWDGVTASSRAALFTQDPDSNIIESQL